MVTNFLVHAGFPRTATTTLQKHLFAKHSQIAYLGKPYITPDLKRGIERLMSQETMLFDKEAWRGHVIQSTIDPHKNCSVLSDERLVSYAKVRDKGVVAVRIKDVLNPSKILFTIRNQFDLLRSAYLSGGRFLPHVPMKYTKLFVGFDDWLEMAQKSYDGGYIAHVDFYKTISYYAMLFGRNNVGVLLFEDFVRNKETFVKGLSDFLGIDCDEAQRLLSEVRENASIPSSQWHYERRASRFYPLTRLSMFHRVFSLGYGITRLFRKQASPAVEFSDSWTEKLQEVYQEGNRRLSQDWKLPLEKYGYPL